MKIIKTKKAPKRVGPYSQAIESGNFIFCSGQIGVDPESEELVEGIERQTRRVLENLEAVLTAADSSMEKVVKTTVYLANMGDYAKMNEIYAEYFSEDKPARATVEVANLPAGALVEIDAIAIGAN